MYEIYEYTFKARGLEMIIYARDDKTAKEIAAIDSEDSSFKWKMKRFFRRKKMLVDVPPYELEQSEFEQAENSREYRRTHKDNNDGTNRINQKP